MKSLHPYLFLPGQCEAALQFYAEALGGRVSTLLRAHQIDPKTPPEHAQRVMHAAFEVNGKLIFMASEGMASREEAALSEAVALAITLESREEQDRVFAALAADARSSMPIHDTFYGGRLGHVTDKYGIAWLLNWDPNEQ